MSRLLTSFLAMRTNARAPSEKKDLLYENAPVCRLRAHGSTRGERDRDETSGRVTVQRTMHTHTATERASRYGFTYAVGRGPGGNVRFSSRRGGQRRRLYHTGPGDTRRALRDVQRGVQACSARRRGHGTELAKNGGPGPAAFGERSDGTARVAVDVRGWTGQPLRAPFTSHNMVLTLCTLSWKTVPTSVKLRNFTPSDVRLGSHDVCEHPGRHGGTTGQPPHRHGPAGAAEHRPPAPMKPGPV